jgi:ribulose-phosphate 3-epimerase
MPSVLIAPSVLAADFAHLSADLQRVIAAGADWLHLDIMDGQFVDNISFGPGIVKTIRGLTELPLDVHLMIERADHYVPRFIEAGASSITVHVEPEAKHEIGKTLRLIREGGCRAGLTLNPETPFAFVEPHLPNIDLLLIMTVHPGFGGQTFEAEMMEKARRAQDLRSSLGLRYALEVDGGITPETARLSIENGADVIVAGTAIFKMDDYAAAIRALRGQESPAKNS